MCQRSVCPKWLALVLGGLVGIAQPAFAQTNLANAKNMPVTLTANSAVGTNSTVTNAVTAPDAVAEPNGAVVNPTPDPVTNDGTAAAEVVVPMESGEPAEAPDAPSPLEWSLTIAGIAQGNLGSEVWKDQADAVYGIDFDTTFHVGEADTMYILLEAGGNLGVDGRIPTFSGWNDHAWGDESIEVSELWYEHQFFGTHLRGKIGKVDLTTTFDTNEYANDENAAFISSGFINNLAVDWCDNTVGGTLWWEPNSCFNVGVGIQSTSGWDDLYHHNFGIVEVGWHPVFCGHQGNYRFYGWAANYPEMWDEEAGEVVEGFSNYGWGFSFDQELTHWLGVWCRYGAKPDREVNPFTSHLSFGFQLMKFAYRPDDVLGFAYGIASITDTYAETLDNAGNERHIELYYSYQFNDKLTLTPNFQWVTNPEGDADAGTVFVLGLRGVFSL